MKLAWIPIVSIIVFRRIEKFWFAVGVSLPFTIASDYVDKIFSSVDPISSVAIIIPLFVANALVLIYCARRWSIAWNKRFTDIHKL